MEAKLHRLQVANRNLKKKLKIATSDEMTHKKRFKVSKQTILNFMKTQEFNTKQITLFDYWAWLC